MDTPTMKSLLERVTARPLPFIGLIIAVIAILFIIWWLLNPSAQQNTTKPSQTIIANQKITQKPVIQINAASTPVPTSTNATSEKTNETSASAPASTTAATARPTPAVNAALPTNRATAEEELDRLKDEQTRLIERKKELAKQLAISDKLLALKEQQLKALGQLNP